MGELTYTLRQIRGSDMIPEGGGYASAREVTVLVELQRMPDGSARLIEAMIWNPRQELPAMPRGD